MTSYVLTETAEGELREILRFIADKDGESRSLHVLEHFEEAFDRLAASPGIGFHRKQLTGPSLRWWPVFRFLILYDPREEPLTVLRIVHGARDLKRLFRREQ